MKHVRISTVAMDGAVEFYGSYGFRQPEETFEFVRSLLRAGRCAAAIIEEPVKDESKDVLRAVFGKFEALVASGRWLKGMAGVFEEVDYPETRNILQTVDGHRAWEAGMASMERVLRAVVCRDVSAFDLAIHEHAKQMDNLRELLSPDARPTLRTQALGDLRSALADMVDHAITRRNDDEIAYQIDRVQAEAALATASKAGI